MVYAVGDHIGDQVMGAGAVVQMQQYARVPPCVAMAYAGSGPLILRFSPQVSRTIASASSTCPRAGSRPPGVVHRAQRSGMTLAKNVAQDPVMVDPSSAAHGHLRRAVAAGRARLASSTIVVGAPRK